MSIYLPLPYCSIRFFAREIKRSLQSHDTLYTIGSNTWVHRCSHTPGEIASQFRVIRLCLLFASYWKKNTHKGDHMLIFIAWMTLYGDTKHDSA